MPSRVCNATGPRRGPSDGPKVRDGVGISRLRPSRSAHVARSSRDLSRRDGKQRKETRAYSKSRINAGKDQEDNVVCRCALRRIGKCGSYPGQVVSEFPRTEEAGSSNLLRSTTESAGQGLVSSERPGRSGAW